MSRRNKIIITVVSAVVFLLLIILIIWLLNRRAVVTKPPTMVNTNQGLQVPADLPSAGVTPGGIVDQPPAVQNLAANIKAVASTFAERFGSYSNESDFTNLDSLVSLVTPQMQSFLANYKASQKSATDPNAPYYGVTTMALSVDLVNLKEDSNQVEALVNTRRQEAKGTTINPKVFYQKLKLVLVKSGDTWQVDSAVWQ